MDKLQETQEIWTELEDFIEFHWDFV